MRKRKDIIYYITLMKIFMQFLVEEVEGSLYYNGQSMYRNVLFLNYAQIAINTNVSETSKLGDISVFLAATRIFR